MTVVNRPVAFAGTESERAANYRTHDWCVVDPEEPMRCMTCDAKTWHVAASYPCGTEPPRETVDVVVRSGREIVLSKEET